MLETILVESSKRELYLWGGSQEEHLCRKHQLRHHRYLSACGGGSHRAGVECKGQGQGQDLEEDPRVWGIWKKRNQVRSIEMND